MITRAVQLSSVCIKRLNNTFSNFLISSCSSNHLYRDKDLEDISDENEAIGRQFDAGQQNAQAMQHSKAHKWIVRSIIDCATIVNTKTATANHSATLKIEYLNYPKLPDDVKNDKLTEDTRGIKIVQNELPDNTSGSIQVFSQSIKDVEKCGDNKKVFDDTKRFVLYNNFDERRFQYRYHSNEYNNVQDFIWFTTIKSALQIHTGNKDNQQSNNHNCLLSLDNVGIRQIIGGIGNDVEPKFHLTGFFSNF